MARNLEWEASLMDAALEEADIKVNNLLTPINTCKGPNNTYKHLLVSISILLNQYSNAW